VPKVLYCAEVVMKRAMPSQAPVAVGGPADAQQFLARQAPLLLTQDPTWTLPPLLCVQRDLTDQDYIAGAQQLGAEPAALRAVAKVEAGGSSGFSTDGRCKIRFELHTFRDETHHKFNATHPHLSNRYSVGKLPAFHHGQSEEWSHLYGAALLRCTEQGIRSTSWGMFQIMGHNYASAGYATAFDFANAMCTSASAQLSAFLQLCKSRHWAKYLVKKDWAGFASRFNGPSYADNKYDQRLTEAYKLYAAPQN
jgi:hypothetical protein